MRDRLKVLMVLMFLAALMACGGGGSGGDSSADTSVTPTSSALGTQVNFDFSFSLKLNSLEDNDLDMDITLLDDFILPMYVQSNGIVTVAAKEFDRIVFRVCAPNTNEDFCDRKVKGLTDNVDLVIDLCGVSVDDADCDTDSTVFKGSVSPTGAIIVNSVAIRVRAFFVRDDLDGFQADDEDKGIATLPRLVLKLTTGSVTTGTLSGVGSSISGSNATLVAGGILPEKMEELSNAHYLATLVGSFDISPLSLLE